VRLCSILFAALLTLVACSSATSGHGALSSPGSPPAPSATSSATTLDCPATAITKTGAPFCYERPPGFTDNSSLNSYGGKWAYKTLVSTARYDLVEVLASRLSFDSDAYSDAKLAAYADRLRFHPGDSGLLNVRSLTPTRVADTRAYQQSATTPLGAHVRAIYAFRGTSVVYIQCERRDQPSKADAGCDAVLASIQIISLG
jgi:hypothetical protein